MLEGLMSAGCLTGHVGAAELHTTVDDSMHIVEIRQAFQYSQRNFPHHLHVDGTYLLVNTIERTLVHALHADTDVGIGEEGAIE